MQDLVDVRIRRARRGAAAEGAEGASLAKPECSCGTDLVDPAVAVRRRGRATAGVDGRRRRAEEEEGRSPSGPLPASWPVTPSMSKDNEKKTACFRPRYEGRNEGVLD